MESNRELDFARCSGNEHALSALRRLAHSSFFVMAASPRPRKRRSLKLHRTSNSSNSLPRSAGTTLSFCSPIACSAAPIWIYISELRSRISAAYRGASRARSRPAASRPPTQDFPPNWPARLSNGKTIPKRSTACSRRFDLAPSDSYANNFLGTAYFLEGNLEASLKYWNRVKSRRSRMFANDPPLRISQALLDHAFAFSPAAIADAA